ncbi:MAG: hydrogenase accessory protein HypB [Bdellovibrionales bacterium RIFOXYC2_FULL_39_8]|nr:MAG: hydrogenase accessory protein HypB [Bdellovibrionales bacterium RIFOXYC2_FULL_39_8]
MCKDCGCHEGNQRSLLQMGTTTPLLVTRKIILSEQSILAKNDNIAASNRNWLTKNNIASVNIMSSPGAGKTFLLEKTLTELNKYKKVSVLVGDQQTDQDYQRLKDHGARAKQINTVSACHLDASMIQKELESFVSPNDDLLIIENVANLVCPAAFDLGEGKRVAMLSVTEGEDKPIKYPVLFNKADLILISKIDLLPHLDWELDLAHKYIRQINPTAKIIELSAKNGTGLKAWFNFLLEI